MKKPKTIQKVIKRARRKDEDQQEEARQSIQRKADTFNKTNYGHYGPTEEFQTHELNPDDIKKQTCSFCGNRFPHELPVTSVEKFYMRGTKRMSYKPPRMIASRVCPSPSCRVTGANASDPTVFIHHA